MISPLSLDIESRLIQEIELGDYRLLLDEILEVHPVDSEFSASRGIHPRSFDHLSLQVVFVNTGIRVIRASMFPKMGCR